MKRDRRVEVGLGRLQLDRQGDDLSQFRRIGTDDMAADDPIRSTVDNNFHQVTRIATGERGLHRPERRLVDIDTGELRARLRLGEADGAYLRLREHRGRNVGMVDLRRPVTEDRIGEGMSLADRDRREVEATRDVANGIDMRHRGA